MKMKKVNAIYFSATQTTKKVVDAVVSVFDTEAAIYDTTLCLGELEVPTFGPDELVVVGFPVYGGRIPDFVAEFYKGLRGQNTPAIAVALYGNREIDDALLELTDYLEAGGFALLAAASFVGEHSFGPEIATGRPDESDLEKAYALGRQAKAKLEAAPDVSALGKITVPGNRPYKIPGPWGGCPPTTSHACTRCGICVANCPMHIIDAQDPGKIDGDRCVRCCSCIKKCPVGAKYFTDEMYLKFRPILATQFAVRKEPVCFI